MAVDIYEVPNNFNSYVYRSNNNNNGFLISLKPFGEHIKMWLNPVDGILAGEDLPIYTFSTDPINRNKVRSEKHIGVSLLMTSLKFCL